MARSDVVDALAEAYRYELYDPVNPDFLMLSLARRRGRPYSREEVAAALELLCVPQLAVLRRVVEGRYALQTPKQTLTRRLRALVAVFEAPAGDAAAEDTQDLRRGR